MADQDDDAARRILRPGGRIMFPPDLGEPDIVARLPELLGGEPTEIVVPHRVRRSPIEGYGDNVRLRSLFGSPGGSSGEYAPLPLSRVPKLLDSGALAVDVALLRLSPADRAGMHSVGPSATLTLDLARGARAVIAEIDESLPVTNGEQVPTEFVTLSVAAREPLEPLPDDDRELSQLELSIGAHVATLIPDGAYLSLGIGAVAQAIASSLHGHRNLRIHSGMISTNLRLLLESDAVDSDWVAQTGEAIGPGSLMSFIDRNQRLSFRSTRHIHDARRLAQYSAFVAVNSVLDVDLFGHVGSEGSASRPVGGYGGLLDFMIGAQRSPQGMSILALPSVSRSGRSKIRAVIPSDQVSAPSCLVDFVVTEWGVADLRAASRAEIAARLLAVAHPDHRTALADTYDDFLRRR